MNLTAPNNKLISLLLNISAAFVIINSIFECTIHLYKYESNLLEDFYSMMFIRNWIVIISFLIGFLIVSFKRKEIYDFIKLNKKIMYNKMLVIATIVFPFIFLPGMVKEGLDLITLINTSGQNMNLKMVLLNITTFTIYTIAFLFSITELKSLTHLIKQI